MQSLPFFVQIGGSCCRKRSIISEDIQILVVAPDATFSDQLLSQISVLEAWSITVVECAAETLESMHSGNIDLLLIANNPEDIDAIELCHLVRRFYERCPIIVVAQVPSDAEEILAMNAGATDYVRQPYSFSVLISHMRAQLKFFRQLNDAAHLFGSFALLPARNLLWSAEGQRISLTKIEASLLTNLYFASSRSVSRGALLKVIWGQDAKVETRSLESTIYRLRRKIEKDPSHPCLLLTTPGGYCLRPEITD